MSWLALLLACCVAAVQVQASSLWHVSIDEAPAPPPDQGPPWSAHALRDKSKLPYEIAGIAGAYGVCLIVVVLLVTLVGRRLRRKNLYFLPSKMLSPKSPRKMSDSKQSQLSPRSGRFTSWLSSSGKHKHQLSLHSVSTVDETILERDRAKNIDEMARLYEAVMLHDREKSVKSNESVQELCPEQSPPELQHLRSAGMPDHQSNFSGATITVDDEIRTAADSRTSNKMNKVTPLSITSQALERTESANSNRSRPSAISIRGQTISSPINFSHPRSPKSPNSYTEEIPLSPRIYTPGPPPPTPGQRSDGGQTLEYEPTLQTVSPPLTPGYKSAAAHAREVDRSKALQSRAPAALHLQNQAAPNSIGSLPFRQAYPEMQSAPPMKTTFLDRRSHLYHGPRTGVPSTPYSPYQPQTPLTPITPRRLATKQELKKSMKRQGGPLSPDDIVPSDEDMWGEPV